LLQVGCGEGSPRTPATARDLAPLEPVDLSGRVLDPLASAEAEVTVLVFLSTTCPISNRYAPTIRDLHGRYEARGVAFYLVYPDPGDSPAQVAEHVLAHGLPGLPVRDPGHQLVTRAHARVTPEAAVFGAVGKRVSLAYHGRIDDRVRDFGQIAPQATTHDLAQALDAVLAGRPVALPEAPAVGCFIEDLQ
jgi:hypothetical protein